MPRRLTCEEVFQRLDDFLDRELSPDEMALVSAHISDCGICAAEHRFETGVLDGMKDKLRRIRMPDDVKARLISRLRSAQQ